MPPKKWDEEEEESDAASAPPASPPLAAGRRRQFEDEEDDDDVLDSWDAAEDSEVEREKARKAADAKAKADAEAAANKKSRTQRMAERIEERQSAAAAAADESGDEETEAERRERLRRTEQEADLKHAEDLFGSIGVSSARSANTPATTISIDLKDPSKTVNLATLPIFHPRTKLQFEKMRAALSPLIAANAGQAHYGLFLDEFVRDITKEMSSDQIKKIASALTRASNEKMKEEKAVGGKKTKAAKTKTSLVTTRANAAEVSTYDEDAFGDDDFM